jgi:(1->4)-alpha-D-glucan 1-alpha-D-glucosylmutase
MTSRPSGTYRLQIHAGFTLFDAAEQLPYLAALGVSAVYLSPLLQATKGSNHGYDVVDHNVIDPDRGGDAGLARLAEVAAANGLRVVVDIVPNHMGVADASQNPAWWELLKSGRDSPFGAWFDVDWNHPGRILLPVLGDDVDVATDLSIVDGELRYYEHRFPIAPGTGHGSPVEVHDRQHYELVNFRRADTEQNYRRFFAVTELAGLRVEDSAVFEATHAEILRWVNQYGVSGIRIDHPDGLADPEQYLRRLSAAAPGTWITVEKITEPGERLLRQWPVAGMTGYDALAEVNGVLVDPSAAAALDHAYQELTGDTRSWLDQVADGKRQVATTILQAEIRRLARLVSTASEPDFEKVIAALTELIVAFGVYRSYLPEGKQYLEDAIGLASSRRPDLVGTISRLAPRLADGSDELAVRFQQATGAVMAKGVEDTAYYRYSRLICLNEVGGDPGSVGLSVADFHAAQAQRLSMANDGMTTLSTHDTKRGEDIRARIAVLAEMIRQWQPVAAQLAQLAPIPNRAFGYLLWQSIVATGLIERARLHAYAEKAMREASDGTRWIDPDAAFEDAVHAAVDAMSDLIAEPGRSNSLSQKLIQLTMPGVPDVYQGSELWEDSLVDPDNRRPVDFGNRAELLAALTGPPPCDDTPIAKLWITATALRTRRDHPELFTDYRPLLAQGPASNHVLAFDRGGAITVATRLPAGLKQAGGWRDSTLTLPRGDYRDLLTGNQYAGPVGLAQLLATYPVAFLTIEGDTDV